MKAIWGRRADIFLTKVLPLSRWDRKHQKQVQPLAVQQLQGLESKSGKGQAEY